MGRIVGRTLLAATLFVSMAAITWGLWAGWDAAPESILPTAITTAIVWGWFVARKNHPGWVRAAFSGAVIGLTSQSLPGIVPVVWQAHSAAGPGDGDAQMLGTVTVGLYLIAGLCAVPIGGVTGVIAAAVQKQVMKTKPSGAIRSRSAAS